jgi:hypothetical protein
MTRAAEVLWLAALLAMVGATWLTTHGRPVTAIVVAVQGLTFTVMALTAVVAARRQP